MERVAIELGDWSLEALPELGGALAACRYRGLDVLRPARPAALEAKGVLACSTFPMVPYVGRIGDGRFRFAGRDFRVPLNFPPEPVAIHGLGWQSAWKVDDRPGALCLSLHAEDERWPWPIQATQDYSAREGHLALDMTVTNLGETPMPSGLGWHPYFERAGARLRAGFSHVWREDREHGQRREAVGPQAGLGELTTVEGLDWDHCFDWPGAAALICLGNGLEVTMQASDTARHAVLFTPPGEDYFCCEPVTHVPGAVNLEDKDNTGWRVLAPGETQRLSVTLSVETRQP